MRTLSVALGDRSYPIHVGSGLLGEPDLILPLLPQKRIAIVTNETIAPLYLEPLVEAFRLAGVDVVRVVLPDG